MATELCMQWDGKSIFLPTVWSQSQKPFPARHLLKAFWKGRHSAKIAFSTYFLITNFCYMSLSLLQIWSSVPPSSPLTQPVFCSLDEGSRNGGCGYFEVDVIYTWSEPTCKELCKELSCLKTNWLRIMLYVTEEVVVILRTSDVTGLLLRTTRITSLISSTKKQTVHIHSQSRVTAADSVSSSLLILGIVLENKAEVMCSKDYQQWGKTMNAYTVMVIQRE